MLIKIFEKNTKYKHKKKSTYVSRETYKNINNCGKKIIKLF